MYQISSIYRRGEEQAFISDSFLDNHMKVERHRLAVLPALKGAVTPILEQYLMDSSGHILEIGCGTGFFYKWMAPEWLKERLVCLEINHQNLQELTEPGVRRVNASGYSLPFAKDSFSAVIGYSSFDSFGDLDRLLDETRVVLIPCGKLVLFQDILPPSDLYEWPKDDPVKSVQTYHESLVMHVIQNHYKILAGREEPLEYLAAEPFDKVKQRAKQDTDKMPPIFIWNNGSLKPITHQTDMDEQGMSKPQAENFINDLWMNEGIQRTRSVYECKPDDVLEGVVLRYLVAEPA